MKFVLKVLFAAAVVAFAASCTDSESGTAKNIITAIQEAADELGRSGGAKCEIKLPASSHYRVVYFYPYTSFDDMKLEAPVKRELKAIAFAVEKPLFAVIGRDKVLAYGEAKLSLEPSRPMPMMWPPQDGAIRIGFWEKPDGQYILY